MIRNTLGKLFSNKTKQKKNYSKGLYRQARFESLESRQLLTITLSDIPAQTLSAGAPLNIALHGSDTTSNPIVYSVSVSNSTFTNNGQLTTTVPTGNSSLRLSVTNTANNTTGDMTFQLFNDLTPKTVEQITNLVNTHKYDNLTFHRIISNFMIQGGDPTGTGSGSANTVQFDDEFNKDLQFTSSGLLAMANSGPDTNGSQFFITVEPTRWLDFNHTIFGMITQGDAFLEALSNVAVDSSSKPLQTVKINSASIFTDTQNGVLRLSAPNGTTGSADVTVTAKDSVTNETVTKIFHVTVSNDTNNDKPFLGTINPVETTANTPVSFLLPTTNVDGIPIVYEALVNPTNANIAVSVNNTTGVVTVTPSNGITGVYKLYVGVKMANPPSSDTTPFDTQYVPLYIKPALPSSIALQPSSDTGTSNTDKVTNLNNTAGKTLQFLIGGTVSGATVELFASNALIGSAVASGASTVVTTNGAVTLPDGPQAITVKQTLKNQTVSVGNLSTTKDLASAGSAAYNITVETTVPQFNFIPETSAVVGRAYACQATTSADSAGGIIYQLTTPPTGMTINASTGQINWTPTADQTGTAQIHVKATDGAGNFAVKDFSINVLAANSAPVLTVKNPSLGSTNEDTPITISLSGSFINNGVDSTTITDSDTSAVVGGIAIISLSGNGTWEYSLDGTTFTTINSVSPATALLLSKDAKLRYTPDGKNADSPLPRVRYHAWDTTSGVNSGRVDLSNTSSLGGVTAYSLENDVATLTITNVNDAPAIGTANPSIGSTTSSASKTITLASFINNGNGTSIITDVDNQAVIGGIAIVGITGGGTWEYSTDGTTYAPFGNISDSEALLLAKDTSIRFTPNVTNSGNATITYRAWDTTSGTNGGKVDLSQAGTTGGVTAFSVSTNAATLSINDAPVLTPAATNPSMGTTNEDTSIIINLSGTFINNGAGTTTITDVNTTDVLGGIAIISTTGSGTWEYSTNGTTYTTLSSVSATSALLLSKDAKLRYTPDSKNGETPTITYRAWDATTGINGSRVDLSLASARGGTTAFSLAADTASLTVTSVNDAPVLTAANPSLGVTAPTIISTIDLSSFINKASNSTTVTDIDTNAVVGGIALTGTTGSGTWEYSTDGTTFTAMETVSNTSALLLAKTAKIRYTPNSTSTDTPTITYRAWDTTSGTSGSKVDASTNGGATAFSSTTDTASLTVASGSISGYVYIDSNNDGQRFTPGGGSHLALPGVILKLLSKNSQGAWVEVIDKSPIMTAADGSYRFDHLLPGTYRIQEIQPSNYLDGLETAGKINNATKGTAGQDIIDVDVGVNENGTEYNFGERGFTVGLISRRLFLASSPTATQLVTQVNTAPTVIPSKSVTTATHLSMYTTGGSPVAIVAQDAGITDPDSTKIASMTISITNPLDGNSETLAATTTNTPIVSSYTNGTLTLTGVADAGVYENVLKTVKYSDSAQSPLSGYRKINIVANDGIANSKVAVVRVWAGTTSPSASAIDEALKLDENWLL